MTELAFTELARWSFVAQEGGNVLGAPQSSAPIGGAGTAGDGSGGGASGPGGIGFFMPILAVMMVFLIISTTMSGRKEKKRRAAMLAAIGKKDRVQTLGGMIGTIVEVKGDEYLLETDRSSNSRAWIAKTAVSSVLRSANKPEVDAVADNETNEETVNA